MLGEYIIMGIVYNPPIVDTNASIIKTTTVTLSNHIMNDLHITAIELVPAQGSGLVVLPTSCYLFIDRNATQTNSACDLFVSWNGANNTSETIYYIRRFMLSESGDRIWHLEHFTGEASRSIIAGDNKPLTIKLDSAVTQGSINSMKVVTTYHVFDNS